MIRRTIAALVVLAGVATATPAGDGIVSRITAKPPVESSTPGKPSKPIFEQR